MWSAESNNLPNARGVRFTLHHHDRPVSVADVLRSWQVDARFRSWFNALLSDSPYTAFRWETPPVTTTSVSQPFEFVLLESPALDRNPDPLAFAEHFGSATDGVIVFPNLGGDATMVVPCPISATECYGHLAAFVRRAPEAQRHGLWKAVAAAMTKRIGERPVWLSTAGAGVSWLHVRLDDRPKYYGFDAYRAITL